MTDSDPTAGEKLLTACCIAGGGPAGMMLGFLLARAGVDVVVLEKHADFLRDFRGDTIHPSTLEIMHELGLLEEFLTLPHERIHQLQAQIGSHTLTIADFSRLPVRCGFIAMIPQWDFLDFLADHARPYSTFHLLMQAEVTDLLTEADRIVGVRGRTPQGPLEVRADLVVAADGRSSIVRAGAGLPLMEFGAPIDVLWFPLSRQAKDPAQSMGRFEAGRIFVMINRGDYWQCGYVISKGGIDEIRSEGLDAFRTKVSGIAPHFADRVEELKSWEDVKLLTVRVDRLSRWFRPGLLAIGDAAHAMSPIGGVGINLAVQDAVAAANVLAEPLREHRVTVDHLRSVQKRREFPTRVTQWLQLAVQQRIIARVLRDNRPLEPPLLVRLIAASPRLRRIPGRIIGMGIRPEHVRATPATRHREKSPEK
jgi:2-polyprenyl-6-methoxyphenol hydroxylase-like FAD-dependent oxidoreductase